MSEAGELTEKGRGRAVLAKVLLAILCLGLVLAVTAAVGGYVYWRSLAASPQYSLALMIDAAREGDDGRVNEFIDFDSVVEDFVPQVTDQAIELYGRGLPPEVVKRAAQVAAPLLPLVKSRARAEIPELLRDRTKEYRQVPFWALAVGAGRYLSITEDGNTAEIVSREEGRPLNLKMERREGKWVIVAVRDPLLAEKLARKIGQEIIFLAKQAGTRQIDEAGKAIGIDGIGDLLKQAEEIFR